jgi:phosphoadenosine phosphosulfate reductase
MDGYYGCFSGGKDSVVIKHLAEMARVKIHWVYNHTTIDPPELVRFIKEHHPDVEWRKPRHGNFFLRMEEKAHIPTRRARWCCDEYKEQRTPKDSTLLMGIRAEESAARKEWNEVDVHQRTNRSVVLPILHWSSELLWEFIYAEGIPYCSLYDEGFTRLGCVGCPLASRRARAREFERWPGFERRWKLSFQRIWAKRAGTLQNNGREWFGSACFVDWEVMWDWWNLNLYFPGEDEFGDPEKAHLSCFVCERNIPDKRFSRMGRICRLCAGRIHHTGPIHFGHGWRVEEVEWKKEKKE